MRAQINDIRIRTQIKEKKASGFFASLGQPRLVLAKANIVKLEEKLQPIMEELDFEESVSSTRRNFLKIAVASGSVLLAGSFLDKINKFKNIGLMNQSALALGPMNVPNVPQVVKDQGLDKDFENFFNNFRLVKNKKEFILSNKHGENILIIDRDM